MFQKLRSSELNFPIYDTHEHFGHENEYIPGNKMSLRQLFNFSYVTCPDHVENDDFNLLCSNLKNYVGSSNFESIRKGIYHIYKIDIYPLNPDKLRNLQDLVNENYSNKNYFYDILNKKENIQIINNDVSPISWDYWKSKDEFLIRNTIRLDDVIFPFQIIRPMSYISTDKKEQLNEFCDIHNYSYNTLDDFEDALEKYLLNYKNKTDIIKIGSAYQRSLHFLLEENDDGLINTIFKKIRTPNSRLNEKEMRRWGNFVVTFLLGFASVEKIPIQIHTGYGTIKETNPMYLLDIMNSFPGVKFDLFHGGYPFQHTFPSIINTTQNAHANLCWLPIISENSTKSLLRELLNWRSHNSIEKISLYGGDCQCIEGSVGNLLTCKQILIDILNEYIEKHKLTKEDAVEIAKKILYNNPKNIYE